MKIYEVEGDSDYLWTNCVDGDITGRLNHVVHDGAEIDRSQPVELEISDWDAPGDWIETDCAGRPAGGALLFSERAVAALSDLLTPSGYVLDTIIPAQTRYKLYVCKRAIEALDEARSEVIRFKASGRVRKVLRYELRAEAIASSHIFRLWDLRGRVFVSDAFVSRVEAHRLTGFLFAEIWSSEFGGTGLCIDRGVMKPQAKRAALRAELAARADAQQ